MAEQEANLPEEQKESPPKKGLNPIKIIFALEYVLQGLANPFQGITYQPFFRHLHYYYGLSESATQQYFSRSYLAWSFKPVIGFLMDAYGKTKITLIMLLLGGAVLYLLTPFLDTSHTVFFGIMFIIAIVFACTDVAVDRATVIEGDEEAKSSGQSKSTTVGLNQAICWGAIYGTSILAAASGGWIAENFKFNYLLYLLALVPIFVLIFVFMLPKDTAQSIPIKDSIKNFWDGLNTGPVLWIIVFYFLFHFQPSLGALWTNHLIENLHFTQTQIGYADGVANIGFFSGVLIFAWAGVKWQDKFGLKNVFRVFIVCSILVNMTQYLLVDPWFTKVTGFIHGFFPGYSDGIVRLCYLATYNFFYAILTSIIRMSTFSIVGAVIPANAAGSLFAGFMSVANLAYSFSYASGSWMYDNGLKYGVFQFFERNIFCNPGNPGDKMSISLLIFIGSMAYILSFCTVHMLPDKKQTQATEDDTEYLTGPEHFKLLGDKLLKTVNLATLGLCIAIFSALFLLQMNLTMSNFFTDLIKADLFSTLGVVIKSTVLSFFIAALIRKVFLDWKVKRV